jgi:O-antigen/teichoic acid export membrane protein
VALEAAFGASGAECGYEMTIPRQSSSDQPQGLLGTTSRILVCKLAGNAAVLGVIAITARNLGPAGRGTLVLLITMASFALLVCSLGVNVSCRIHLVAQNAIPLGDYLGLSYALALLQVTVCVIVSLTLLPLAGVDLDVIDIALFGALGAGLFLQYLLNDALNAYGLLVPASIVEAFGFFSQLLLVLAIVLADMSGLRPFVAAFILSTALQCIAALGLLRRNAGSVRPTGHLPHWKRLIVTGWPGIGSGLGQVLTFRIDRYFVGLFLSPAAVGIYSVAATAPELLRLPPLALGQPIFHRLASRSAHPDDFRRARRLCLLLTTVLALVAFVAAPYAVHLLFGPQFMDAVTPLRILLLGEFGITLFYLDNSALGGLGHLPEAAIASIVGLCLVAAADVVLIQKYGLAGAAWASVLAYSVMGGTAHAFLSRRQGRTAPSTDHDH